MIEYLSQTMINQWLRCGEQFRRRFLEGQVIPPGIAAKIGTGLHKGAEVNHRYKLVTGEDEPLTVVTDAARDGYVKSLDSGVFFPPDELPGAKKKLAEGVDVTVNLAALYHRELAPKIQPTLIEKKLALEVPGFPVRFEGTIDLLATGHNWHDIKSSDKRWPEGRADSEIQATLYWKLVKEYHGKAPNRLFYDVFTKSGLVHQQIETTRTEADFEALVRTARVMLQSIEAGIFHPAMPGSWICSPRFCGFWWTCPAIPDHKKILPKRSI